MENLADTSEPQVLPNEQKDKSINFPNLFSILERKKELFLIKVKKY